MLARSAHSLTLNARRWQESVATAAGLRDSASAVPSGALADLLNDLGPAATGGGALDDVDRSSRSGGTLAFGQSSPTWTGGGISCSVALRIDGAHDGSCIWATRAYGADEHAPAR